MGDSPFFRWENMGIPVPLKLVKNLPFPKVKQVAAAAVKVKNVAHGLIREKREKAAKGVPPSVDIISVAMESGGFSDEELANQLMTFLAAGHETTSSALTWTTYLMCTHPDIQTRLRNEIREALFNDGRLAESVDSIMLDKLPYLNAVANEVLRYMPSVPLTTRVPVKDTTIQGQFIPKGTMILVAAYGINVSEEFWGEDANEFNPERWLTDENKTDKTGGSTNNFANLTFIHGPRSCIGKDFSRAELLCLIAAWFGRFEVELEHPDLQKDIIGWVTIRPRHGLPVRFKEIDA